MNPHPKRSMPMFMVSFTVILFLSGSLAISQSVPNLAAGITPYQAFQNGSFDHVNLSNGNVAFSIPIITYPQRGSALKLQFSITANSKALTILPVCPPKLTCTDFYELASGWNGNNLPQVADDQAAELDSKTGSYTIGGSEYTATIPYVMTPDGSEHWLALTNSGFQAVDGSGWFDGGDNYSNGCSSHCSLISGNGIWYGASGSSLVREDANGNQITWTDNTDTAYYDTLHRAIPLPPAPSSSVSFTGCIGPLATVAASDWNLPGPNGSTLPYKLCYADAQILYNKTSYNETHAQQVLQSVQLPNGQSWVFTYDEYGDVTSITMPTGGQINYTYEWNYSGVYSSSYVTSRTVVPANGTGPFTWNYSYSNSAETTTVTDPVGNQAIYTFSGPCTTTGVLYNTETQYYQGTSSSGTLLKTIQKSYQCSINNNATIAGPQEINVFLNQATTIWPNGQEKQNKFTYGDSFLYSPYDNSGEYVYGNSYGHLTQIQWYDYGDNSPGALLRQWIASYVAPANSTYLAANLLNLKSFVDIEDGNNNIVSATDYGYDAGTPQGSGITTQHAPPPNGINLGNLTSISRENIQGGYWLDTGITYYDTGVPYQRSDEGINTNGSNWTTYSYSSSFAGAYLTQTQFPTTNGINHIVSANYDFNTGLMTSFTGENGNTTDYAWDDMERPLQVTLPPTQAGQGVITYSYDDIPGQLHVDRQQSMSGGQNTDLQVWFDGLGRATNRDVWNGSQWSQTDTCYNPLGLASFRAYPYFTDSVSQPSCNSNGTSDGNPGDSTSFDALDRPLQITHSDGTSVNTSYAGRAVETIDEGNNSYNVTRISQVNGLNELTNVCEVDSQTLGGNGGSPMACNLDIAGTGFLTNYYYDALGNLNEIQQNGLNNRSFSYDSLSRITSANNPETGIVDYTYDYAACSASASPGDLTCRTDPRGITTSYFYDALHRITQKDYSGGTPTVTYNYDQSNVWNQGLTNTVGRLSYAGTSANSGEIFAYDAMGRIVHNARCTPANCGSGTYDYYYNYDLAGDPTSVNLAQSQQTTETFNDAQQPISMTSNIGDAATVVSGITYNARGELTAAALGDGISESRGYDARGRLTSINYGSQYSATVGYAPDSDVISSTDSVNGNWSYGYDPLNRLISANQSGGYAIAYSYDRFGNMLTQSISPTPNPAPQNFSYNADNQIVGASYDASGDLLTDPTTGCSFQYDAEHRITAVSGCTTANYAYNAAGQRDYADVNGMVKQYIRGPLPTGEAWAEFNGGGGLIASELRLNGMDLASFNGSTYYDDTDWLGTVRLRADDSGGTVETDTNLPYGGWLNQQGAISPIHFTGQVYDSETSLTHFSARYQSGMLGRFMTPDPGPWNLANPQTLNRYVYTADNPVTLVDPTGLFLQSPSGSSNNSSSSGQNQCSNTETNCHQQKPKANHAHHSAHWHVRIALSGNRGGGTKKGERRHAAKPDGTPDPVKHVHFDPKRERYYVKDPHTGKRQYKGRDWKPENKTPFMILPPIIEDALEYGALATL